MSWQKRGIAALRITFGLIWGVAAWLKWQPGFLNSFADQVAGAKGGQPGLVQAWITLWANLITTNPMLFAFLLAVSAGRYYSLDRWLSPGLGRFSFLAAGRLK